MISQQSSKKIVNILKSVNFSKKYTQNKLSSLIRNMNYNFVHIPISSKFYHHPLPNNIIPCIILCQKQQKLQQKMVLLEHITEIIQKDPRLMTQHIKYVIVKQLKKWQNSRLGRMEKVATIVWLIRKLKLQKQLSTLYNQILQRIRQDQWYVNKDQSIKALETFTNIPNKQLRNEIYEKIQRNVSLTVKQDNMRNYQRIMTAIVEAQRYDSPLFDHYEKQILRTLGMTYDTHTLFQIINCYAISRKGSSVFYEVIQGIMYKGHAYNQAYYFVRSGSHLQTNGEYLARLAQSYGIVQQHTPIPLNSDFLDYLYKSFMNPKTKYQQIDSLTKILKSLPMIEFDKQQIKQLTDNIIYNKKFNQIKKIQDLYQFYGVIKQIYGEIPKKVNENICKLLIKQIDRKQIPVVWAIQATNFIILNQEPDNPNQSIPELIQTLGQYIDHKYKYLYPEDQKALKQSLEMAPQLPPNFANYLLPSKNTTQNN